MQIQRHAHVAVPEDGSVLTTGNRLLAGALFGGQIVWLSAVVPTCRRLTSSEYIKVHTLLTWYGDGLMPAVGVSTTLTGYLRYRRSGSLNALVGTAALTTAGIAAVPNLRINGRMRELRSNPDAEPSERELHRDRDRWAFNHAIRTAGGLVAFVALLSDGTREVSIGRPRTGSRFGWMDAIAGLVVLVAGREVSQHVTMMARNRSRPGLAPTN
jgi:hypothetical protein